MFPVDCRPDFYTLKSEIELFYELYNADPGLEEAFDKINLVIKKVVSLKFSLKLCYKLCHLIVTAFYGVESNKRIFIILKFIKNIT